jgi:hypothetical protein
VREERQVHQHAHHHPVVAPGDGVAANPERVVVPGGPIDLAARAAKQGVVDHQPHRRTGRDQQAKDQVEQAKAELVGRPAGRREEPVRAAVMPGCRQAGRDQHAGDGVGLGLGPEPDDQGAEDLEGGGGEAAAEALQQAGDRAG